MGVGQYKHLQIIKKLILKILTIEANNDKFKYDKTNYLLKFQIMQLI